MVRLTLGPHLRGNDTVAVGGEVMLKQREGAAQEPPASNLRFRQDHLIGGGVGQLPTIVETTSVIV
jgi:hypothetical protein